MKFFLIIIFFILLVPFPLKISISYSKENYYIKLYKFNIISKDKSLKSKGTVKKEKKKKAKSSILKNKKLIRTLISSISKNRFKPILNIKGTIHYSLNDHSVTAISYGIISAIIPFIYKALGVPFRIKKFSLPISPIFKEIFHLKLHIEGIIYISFGQIIYISFLILQTIISERVKKYE